MTATLQPEMQSPQPHGGHTGKCTTTAGYNRSRRLMVVDDEFLIGLQMANLMENLGWSILGPAVSLEEAAALLAEEELPDIAILDININGESVFPFAEALHRKGVLIIFCTGYDVPEETSRFPGCTTLQKPVGVNQIFNEVNAMMRRKMTACA